MKKKTIKTTLLAAIPTAVVCAGTVSARELLNAAQGPPHAAADAAPSNLVLAAAFAPLPHQSPRFVRRAQGESYLRGSSSARQGLAAVL
jgi:hypothetical protein